jgi:predicted ribosomally synthesized peptide with SipW-like signal peptide
MLGGMKGGERGEMKNIFLSVVVICALAVAGVGGTLAGFSDTELSEDNYFEVGSLDLKVSYKGVEYDDPFVPTMFNATKMWPCISKDFTFDMHSLSEPDGELAYAYIHFKDFLCDESPSTKHPTGRPEPENVAEGGGWLANVNTAPLGPLGQDCTLPDYVEIYIEFDLDGDGILEPILGNPIWGDPGTVYLGELDCWWIDLGVLPACQTRDGKVSLHISQIPEEDFGYDYFPDDKPFNDWPTNALMLDKCTFSVEFALTQDPIPPDQVWPGT